MKKENQKAILMLMEEPINSTGTPGSTYNARAHIEEIDGNYVLRVQERLIIRDEILTRDITPQMVLKWSLDNMGDYFGAYLKWFSEEKRAARKAAAE